MTTQTRAFYIWLYGGWIVLAIVFLLVVFGTTVQHERKHANRDVLSVPESEEALNLAYVRINNDTFFNTLPREGVVVRWANLTAQHDIGYTEQMADGGWKILIDRETNPTVNSAEMTEIHEMCHIKTLGKNLDTHGPAWEGCMIDQAARGAFFGLW